MTSRTAGMGTASIFVAMLIAGSLEEPGAGHSLSCFGKNRHDQRGLASRAHGAGNGATENQTTPIAVLGLAERVSFTAGTYNSCVLIGFGAGGSHRYGPLDSNSFQCWGAGDRGQLGNGWTDHQLTPMSVVGVA